MAWKIEFLPQAQKDFRRLDTQASRRILSFLFDRLAHLDDPRSIGGPLAGERLGQFWKYRVGDYRLITDIQDGCIRIDIVRVGHRSDIYR